MLPEQSEASPAQFEAKLTGVDVRLASIRSAGSLDERGLAGIVEVDTLAVRPGGPAGGACAVADLLSEGHSRPARTDERLSFDQRHLRLGVLHADVEHGAAHADRRVRR